MSKDISSIILSLVLFLFTIIGSSGVYFFNQKKLKKKTDFVLSSLFSFMIMIFIVYLLPEVYHCLGFKHLYLLFIFLIVGFILMKIFDHFIPNHSYHKLTKKELKNNYIHIAIMCSIVFIIYNIVIGMELYNTILASTNEAVAISISLSLRNIFLGFTIYNLINQEKFSKVKKILIIFLVGISSFIGTIFMMLIGINNIIVSGILFSLIIGLFIYFIVYELYRRVIPNIKKKETIHGIILGIIWLLICSII